MSSETTAADGLPAGRRRLAVASVSIGIIMAVLDAAIANIALPTISHDLGVTPASSVWIVNAYQIAVTVALLPFASLGDIVGHRRVFRAGLAVFTIASLACALSSSLLMLSIARVVQGLGAAGIMCADIALVRFSYPSSRLGRAIGVIAMVVGVSAAVGPTVAASILSLASWPWLFGINVPLGILAYVLSARSLPASPPSHHRFDALSALLSVIAFGLLIVGLDGVAHGQAPLVIALELAGALGAGVVLVRHQASLAVPLVPVDLFRRPIFALSAATSVCSFATQSIAFVTLPFFLQARFGLSAVATGMVMTPWPLVTASVAPIAGRLSDRYPAGLLGGIGLALLSGGLVLLALLPAAPSTADIAWRMMVCGLGFGLFQTPNNRAMVGGVPRERSGSVTGVVATARLLGQTTGAALVALMFGLAGAGGREVGHAALLALLLGAAVAAVAAVASSLRLMAPQSP